MDRERIEELIKLMKENDLAEIELDTDEGYIRIRAREAGGLIAPVQVPVSGPAPAAPGTTETSVDTSGLIEIKSPMVGTFYRAPAPDADPYVKEGDKIEIGQVLCIIEAMKLMNEIKSEVSGTVEKILVENAQPVEYGQVLFLIRPN